MFKINVLILGSLIVITHSANAATPVMQVDTISNKNSTLKNLNTQLKIAKILYDKGLDESIAKEKVVSLFTNNSTNIDIGIMNLQTLFPQMPKDSIEQELSTAALFNKTINFASYDDMLGLVQKIALKNNFSYEASDIQKLVELNKA